MLYKLDEYWIEELKKASNLIHPGRDKDDNPRDVLIIGQDIYIEVDYLLSYIENLDYELEHKMDEIRDLKNDIESNYKPITKEEQYGVSNKDFI